MLIGGNFSISQNGSLTNLIGMESLTTVIGRVWIYSNLGLKSLNGLEVLTAIGGDVEIYSKNLLNLSGLII